MGLHNLVKSCEWPASVRVGAIIHLPNNHSFIPLPFSLSLSLSDISVRISFGDPKKGRVRHTLPKPLQTAAFQVVFLCVVPHSENYRSNHLSERM